MTDTNNTQDWDKLVASFSTELVDGTRRLNVEKAKQVLNQQLIKQLEGLKNGKTCTVVLNERLTTAVPTSVIDNLIKQLKKVNK